MGPNEKKLGKIAQEATEWVTLAIEAVKAAPGNEWGDDNEVIAGEILKEIDKKI